MPCILAPVLLWGTGLSPCFACEPVQHMVQASLKRCWQVISCPSRLRFAIAIR